MRSSEVWGHTAYHYWSQAGTIIEDHRFIKLILPGLSGLGRQALSGKIWLTLRHSWKNGAHFVTPHCSYRIPDVLLHGIISRYNDDISLEDAIHTALLTLKEGFEGQMTEKTIEIGVVTVPTPAELEEGKIGGETGRPRPTFRKLTEEEVRDYLAL